MAERTGSAVKGRIWKFGAFELEEVGRTLRKDGELVEIGGKPLDLLICLLEAKTANVTKPELKKQVWLVDAVEDSVIKVTVSTLRRILGDQDQVLVLTVYNVGYRMGVPVSCLEVDEIVVPRYRLLEGASVPDKPSWHLEYALDRTTPHWVWAAKQDTNGLVRVFKFAEDGVRYGALQREITLNRLLAKAAPKATCFVKVFDWRLEASPYYVESEFGGINLLEWAAKLRDPESGGLPRPLCLQVMAELCDAVDIAHEIGVFHNDLKPSNILLSQAGTDGAWHVKVSDFGIATLLEPHRLVELDITNHGFGDDPTATSLGSAMYHAPEVKPGQPSTRSADIYAIGVILYQLLTGDFAKTPTPGWQSDIDDVILQRDIEEAVNLKPVLRLKSASELAVRLRTLEARRQEERDRVDKQQRIDATLSQIAKSRARRPFLISAFTAILLVLLGLSTSLWFYKKALREEKEEAQINRFLADDLLSQANPNVGSGVNETLTQAIEAATPLIDERFHDEPRVAASVHDTIADALDNVEDFKAAAQEWDKSASAWIKADGPRSQNALLDQFLHVFLEARSMKAGSLERANILLAKENIVFNQIRQPSSKVRFAKLNAEGMIDLASGKTKDGEAKFKSAVELGEHSTDIPEGFLFSAKQRFCVAELRTGEASAAEVCFRELMATVHKVEGSDNGNTLVPELSLAQALLFEGKYSEAISAANELYPKLVKQLGPDNELTQNLLGIRASAEAELQDWNHSIPDTRSLYEIARKKDPTGFMAVGTISDLGLEECRAGKFEDGEADARDGLQLVSSPGQPVGMKGVVDFALASCIILSDSGRKASEPRLAEAEKLLGDINIPLTAATEADPAWGGNVDLARAQLALARRNYAAASDYLAKAKPAFDSPNGEPYQRQAIKNMEGELKNGLVR